MADDCALEAKGITGRRGIAGTVFVHKVLSPLLLLSCSATECHLHALHLGLYRVASWNVDSWLDHTVVCVQ